MCLLALFKRQSVFCTLLVLSLLNPAFAQQESASIQSLSGLYQQTGFQSGRAYDDGTRSVDTIDPLSGRLQLTHTDAVIPGTGGFSLPIIRYYNSRQEINSGITKPQTESTLNGFSWNLHFGRLRYDPAINDLAISSLCNAIADPVAGDENPLFEESNGTRHRLYTPLSSNTYGASLVSKADHKMTCLTDGSIVIEAGNGMRYEFGKQVYINGGSASNAVANSQESLVVHDNSVYVTKISDRNDNSFTFEYSNYLNSDGNARNDMLLIDRVLRNGNEPVAEFTYNDYAGNYSTDNSATELNLVLRQIEVIDKIVRFDYSQPITTSFLDPAIHQLIKVADGQNGNEWDYQYYESLPGLDPSSFNLEFYENTYGGKTSFEYTGITRINSSSINSGIMEKTLNGGRGSWAYTYEVGGAGDMFDETTVEGPENIRTVFKHCSSIGSGDCLYMEGRLIEKETFGPGAVFGSTSQQLEKYTWRRHRTISDELDTLYGFGLAPVAYDEVATSVLVQKTTARDGLFFTTQNYDFDEFGFPQTVIESFGNSEKTYPVSIDGQAPNGANINDRRTDYTYTHKTETNGPWVLGLSSSQTVYDDRVEGANPSMAWGYDAKGNMTSEPTFSTVNTYTHDGRGNVLTADYSGEHMKKFSNHVLGTPQAVQRDVYTKDTFVNYTGREVHTKTGRVVNETDGIGRQYNYLYDDIGRLTFTGTPKTDDADITRVWDSGTKTSTTTRGISTIVEHVGQFGDIEKNVESGPIDPNDPTGPMASVSVSRDYDAYGRITFVSNPSGGDSADELKGVNYTYDGLHRLTKIESTIDGSIIKLAYDGNIVTITDRREKVTTYEYRSFGNADDRQLIAVSEPENISTIYDRSKFGPILKVTQESINADQELESLERTYVYNNKYQIQSQTSPETGFIQFEYTPDNLIERETLDTGAVIDYGYYVSRQLHTVSTNAMSAVSPEIANQSIEYDYTLADEMRLARKIDVAEWIYEYDDNGNLEIEELLSLRPGAYRAKFTHHYDRQDVRSYIQYPDDSIVQSNPDGLGRSTRAGVYVTNATYHKSGLLESIDYGNTVTKTITFDDRLLPSEIVFDLDGSAIIKQGLGFDLSGNLTDKSQTITFPDGPTPERIYKHVYDEAGRLTDTTLNGTTFKYSYDGFGNLLTASLPQADIAQADVSSIAYGIDSQTKRLLSVTGHSDGDRSIGYDDHGNVATDSLSQYGFDDMGSLRSVTDISSNDVVNYLYDAHGRRIMKEEAGSVVFTLYSKGGTLLWEAFPQTGETTQYIYLGDTLVASVDESLSDTEDYDGDGRVDSEEGVGDLDQDGIPNYEDTDSDGDGIDDIVEGFLDSDNDGIPDAYDFDSDADGILDIDEQYTNNMHCGDDDRLDYDSAIGMVLVPIANGSTEFAPYGSRDGYGPEDDFDDDGIINKLDFDIDGDGAPNSYEREFSPSDFDCDGYPNWFDGDSDNDQWHDRYEIESEALDADLDGDGMPNFVDLDSDNMGEPDIDEAPLGYGNIYLQYVEFDRQDYNGDQFIGVIVQKLVIEEFNEAGTKVLVKFPVGIQPDLVANWALEFRAPGSLPDLAQEWDYWGKGDSITGTPGVDCRDTREGPWLKTGSSSGTGGLGGSNWLPVCKFSTYEPPELQFNPYRFKIAGSVGSLEGEAIVFTVENVATEAGTVGTLQFLREYDGDFLEVTSDNVVTDEQVVFDGQTIQRVLDREYVPQAPYIQKTFFDVDDNSFSAPADTPVMFMSGGIVKYIDGKDTWLISQSRQNVTLATELNQVGAVFGMSTTAKLSRTGFAFNDEYSITIQALDNTNGRTWSVSNLEELRLVDNQVGAIPAGQEIVYLYEVNTLSTGNYQPSFADVEPDPNGYRGQARFLGIRIVPLNEDPSVKPLGTTFYPIPGQSDLASSPEAFSTRSVATRAVVDSDSPAIVLADVPDSDGDKIPDHVEIRTIGAPVDSDFDGTPDYLDEDSDNDGIDDIIEARTNYLNPTDTDGMGAPDYVDADSDNDGILDLHEGYADVDLDGIPNYTDLDSDGDFIPDSIENASAVDTYVDSDGDGRPDFVDNDSDNDSIPDHIESGPDGINPRDTDFDGIPDHLDLDSDNDGTPDIEEVNGVDTDDDGLPDDYEVANGLDPNDPDDANTDIDNDGLNALGEYQAGTDLFTWDTDGDGIPDGYEVVRGFNPLVDDAANDLDNDGISNLDDYLQSLIGTTIVYRINAGGPELADSSMNWAADDQNSSAFADAGEPVQSGRLMDVSDISLPAGTPSDLFNTKRGRVGSDARMNWSFDVEPGAYEVRLYFAETTASNDRRLINVQIEDAIALDRFDIFSEVGVDAGVMRSFRVEADASLDIFFETDNRKPIISGIEILSIDGDGLPSLPDDTLYRVNVGGAAVLDGLWSVDTDVNPSPYRSFGQARTVSNYTDLSNLPIDSAATNPLFRTKRRVRSDLTEMTWAFPIESGDYEVTLYFSENHEPNFPINKRKMDLQIESIPIVGRIDIGGEVGGDTALAKTYIVSSDDMLDISLIRSKDNAVLHAIEVSKVDLQNTYRINTGGRELIEGGWGADTNSSPSEFVNDGNALTESRAIDVSLLTGDLLPSKKLFQSRRRVKSDVPDMNWSFPVTPGEYDVTLYFAETVQANWVLGRRFFDVEIEGDLVLNDFDVFAEAGGDAAISKNFRINSDDILKIDLLRVQRNPIISGIAIHPVDGGQ